MKKPAKNIQISLRIESDVVFQKLTKSGNNMTSWILGEKIAKMLKNGRRNIEINLDHLFLANGV